MRRFLLALSIALMCVLVSVPVHAQQRETRPSVTLLAGATTTASGLAYKPAGIKRTFQAYGATTAGAGSATIVIEVTNIETPTGNADWITVGTITLTLGTTRTTDGLASDAPWRNVRARVTAISGTGASVTILMGS